MIKTLCITFSATVAMTASADILTITQTGLAGGSLGGQSFSPRSFTFTSLADTSQRQVFGTEGYWVPHISSQVTIANIGTFDVLIPTKTFVSHTRQIAGYSRGGESGFDLFWSPQSAQFTTWDMLAGIGPISGTAGLLQWSATFGAVNTSGGVLILNNGPANGSFTAVIPTPGSCAAIAMAGMFAARRRRVVR